MIGGTFLFVFGEFVKVLVVIPLQKYREQAQVTLDLIDFYANRICDHFSAEPSDEGWELIKQIRDDLRSSATQLSSKYASISFKKRLVKLKALPPAENLAQAYKSLMYLSNSILREGTLDKNNNAVKNSKEIDKVKAALTLWT